MKILYVGTTNPIGLGTHYISAFQKMGHFVETFDPKLFEVSGPIAHWVMRVTKAPPRSNIRRTQDKLVRLCRKNDFDFVFNMAENFLGHEWIDAIRAVLKASAPQFIYHSHDNNFSPGILKPANFWESLAKYELVFTTKSQNVWRYQEMGLSSTHFIPSAYEPSVHRPIPSSESQYQPDQFNVTFIGTYDGSRERFISAIPKDLIHIWGNGWHRFSKYSLYRSRIYPKAIYHQDFSDVVSNTKINLGLLREEAQDLHTTRTFEIPAAGGFQLAPRNDEILSFFEEGKEIVCFSSPQEMNDKIQYYLNNETARKKIARAGHERCLKGRHSYLDRAGTMLKLVKPIKKAA